MKLSASGSTDPDGDMLTYRWFCYPEAGTLAVASGRSGAPVSIEHADQPEAFFTMPRDPFRPGSLHVILAVTDDGAPALTRYRRVIIETAP